MSQGLLLRTANAPARVENAPLRAGNAQRRVEIAPVRVSRQYSTRWNIPSF